MGNVRKHPLNQTDEVLAMNECYDTQVIPVTVNLVAFGVLAVYITAWQPLPAKCVFSHVTYPAPYATCFRGLSTVACLAVISRMT